MELMIALVLFVGLVACWLVLPGSTSRSAAVAPTAPRELQPEAHGALQQAT